MSATQPDPPCPLGHGRMMSTAPGRWHCARCSAEIVPKGKTETLKTETLK